MSFLLKFPLDVLCQGQSWCQCMCSETPGNSWCWANVGQSFGPHVGPTLMRPIAAWDVMLCVPWCSSMYAPSQWEMALQCNAISHWLGAYTEWSLFLSVRSLAFRAVSLVHRSPCMVNSGKAIGGAVGPFNSLWPSDATWRHRSGSMLVEVITCLMSSSHHQNHR